jgi:hypothetical protein
MIRLRSLSLLAALALPLSARAGDPAPAPPAAAKPDASNMPHMSVDVKKKQLRIECEALAPQMPLEFFVCMTGTAEHEAVLRSSVKPSHVHLGLLMLGLEPGEPVHYSKAADKWLPPHGPPLQIFAEWDTKDGKHQNVPAYRLMRNVKTKKAMPPMTWIFAGSRVMEDKRYAADTTGYLVSVVNFDLTVIDIPDLASSDNAALEWEINPDTMPEKGSKVWLVIEPAGKDAPGLPTDKKPATSDPVPAAPNATAAPATTDNALTDVKVDEQKVKALRARWDAQVSPRHKTLREAAQAHYEVLNALRREQNRLIDEADRVQRVIDQLSKEYQEMTTPQPENEKPAPEAKSDKPVKDGNPFE